MNLPTVSLADLLRALAGLHPAEHAAAAQAAGYAPRPGSAPPPPAPAPDLQLPRLQPAPAAAPAALPQAPQAQSSPRHWRVAAVEPVDDQQAPRPAWLQATPAWQDFVSDPAALVPPALSLASPARTAAALRRVLLHARPGPGVDVPAVAQAWSRGRVLRRLPRPLQRRWPARLQVVLDLSPRQAPLHADLLAWCQQVQRQLGGRVQVQRVSGLPYVADAQGRLQRPFALDGSPLLVLGDLGLYDGLAQPERGPVHGAWVGCWPRR